MSEDSSIPTVNAPEKPDLRCREHVCVYELLHSLLGRLMELEARVGELEDRDE